MAENKPPWGSDKEFNAQKAWDLIQNLRKDIETGKEDLKTTKAKLATVEGERDAAVKKVDEATNSGKSESEQLAAKLAEMEKKLEGEQANRLRAEVVAAKGLSPVQAKRLSGATKEELEADADELLDAFPTASNGGPPSSKPRQQLRGGGDPNSEPEETDPAKLAAAIPRI